jgi:hypothetical protein
MRTKRTKDLELGKAARDKRLRLAAISLQPKTPCPPLFRWYNHSSAGYSVYYTTPEPHYYCLVVHLCITGILHVDSLVETKYAIALQVSIDSVWCVLSAGIRNVEVRSLGRIVGWGVGDVRDENKAGRLDRFDEGRSE